MMKDNVYNPDESNSLFVVLAIALVILFVCFYNLRKDTQEHKDSNPPVVKTKAELDDEYFNSGVHYAKDAYSNCYWWLTINDIHTIECSKIGR